MEKFSELHYQRPNLRQLKANIRACIRQLNNARSYRAAKDALLAQQAHENAFHTQYVLCTIRNSINVHDIFYENETAFFNKALPALIGIQKKWTQALLASPYRPVFAEEYGSHLFDMMEADERTSSVRIVKDLTAENRLKTKYQKLTASMTATFKKKKWNIYGILKFMQDPDREIRRGAFLSWAELFTYMAPQLDKIYDQLLKHRQNIAGKLHFKTYTPVAYLNLHRLDYTPKDTAQFRAAVRDYVVPACMELRDAQAARIGVDQLKFYDETFLFHDGNPIPSGDKDTLLQCAQKMCSALSAETGEFFDFMASHDLFDLQTRKGKREGDLCTLLYDYKAPFIFSNFNGTAADVDVLTHETGHAFAFYAAARTQTLAPFYYATSEISEIHAIAMEHFAYPFIELFFKKDHKKHLYAHLNNALMSIPYIACVDEFQTQIYGMQNADAKTRRHLWKSLEQVYMPWRNYDGEPYMESGGFWLQKLHIFQHPFYYIDYALAQISAFELFLRMLKSQGDAWADYLTLCKSGGSLPYKKLLEQAHLSNPFSAQTVRDTTDRIMHILTRNPYHTYKKEH